MQETNKAEEWAEKCLNHCIDQKLAQEQAWVIPVLGWAKARRGISEARPELIYKGFCQMQLRELIDENPSLKNEANFSQFLGMQTEVILEATHIQEAGMRTEILKDIGYVEKGFEIVEEALSTISKTGEGFYKAEIVRLKGELLAKKSPPQLNEAESCFYQAIEIARGQKAMMLELRSTVSLCQLWKGQGKNAEAKQMLTEIYGWFKEGFNTQDLVAAKSLLSSLKKLG